MGWKTECYGVKEHWRVRRSVLLRGLPVVDVLTVLKKCGGEFAARLRTGCFARF